MYELVKITRILRWWNHEGEAVIRCGIWRWIWTKLNSISILTGNLSNEDRKNTIKEACLANPKCRGKHFSVKLSCFNLRWRQDVRRPSSPRSSWPVDYRAHAYSLRGRLIVLKSFSALVAPRETILNVSNSRLTHLKIGENSRMNT